MDDSYKNVLERAKNLVEGDRRRDYSNPLDNHLDIAIRWSLKNLSAGYNFIETPYGVAWKMVDVKQSRDSHKPKQDNQDDTVGYMTCIDAMHQRLFAMGVAKTIEEANLILNKRDLVHLSLLFVQSRRFSIESAKEEI